MAEPGLVRFPPVQLVRHSNPTDDDFIRWTLKYFAGSPLGWITLWEIQTDAEAASSDAMELIAVKINEAYNHV